MVINNHKIKKLILPVILVILLANSINYLQPINIVKAQIEIPTPREETAIIWGYYWPGMHENPLVPPYSQYMVLTAIMGEFLWYYNVAQGEWVFCQATGWEYSEDYTTFTINLRHDVKWNDGVAFTSKDVKFTIDLMMSNNTFPYYTTFTDTIDSVSTPDDYTVVIELKSPQPRYERNFMGQVYAFFMVAPEHIWKNYTVAEIARASIFPYGDYVYVEPVLTGPYKFLYYIEESGMGVFERNEDYWGKKYGWFPEPKYVVVRRNLAVDIEYRQILDGETFDAGNVDGYSKEMIESLIAIGTNITYCPFVDVPTVVHVCCGRYPLNDAQVRRAISYTIDWESIANLYPAANVNPVYAIDRMWDPNFPQTDHLSYPDIMEQYRIEFDLTKAAALLDSLNIIDRNSDGIRETANGTKMSFRLTLWSMADPPPYQIWIDDAAKVGIEIIISDSIVWETGDFDFIMKVNGGIGSATQWGEAMYLMEPYTTARYVPLGQMQNYLDAMGRFPPSAEIDALYNAMVTISPDDPAMDQYTRQAVEIVMSQLPVIPGMVQQYLMMWSSKYWTGWPTTDNQYWQPLIWGPELHWILLNLRSTGATPNIIYSNVWIKGNVAVFNGTDRRLYGPFVSGDYVKLPKLDADNLIASGLASTTAPVSSELQQLLQNLVETSTQSSSDLNTIKTTLNNLNTLPSAITTLSNEVNTLSMYLLIEGVALVVVIILVVLLLVKKK